MVLDVAIIGAGPCSLAVAARLRERMPSALFTDVEHARFWGRAYDQNTIENETKQLNGSKSHWEPSMEDHRSIAVFDAHSNKWMSSWRAKFKTLNISHLRSPLFFHPDPQDRDGLLAFAHAADRAGELCEIRNVVGKEVSKHRTKTRRERSSICGKCRSARHLNLDNRDQNDYFTPSSSLFDAYIDSIVDRYHLKDLVQHSKIVDLSYNFVPSLSAKLFTIQTSTGESHFAKAVVLATGPINTPQIPPSLPLLSEPNQNGSATHVFDTQKPLIPPHIVGCLASNHPTIILIVGGGLTTAQLADHLLRSYRTLTIHLLVRSRLKVKHFDVDLPWVTKLRNREMAAFWSADSDEERFEMLQSARGGGSITPSQEKILRRWEGRGRLIIWEGFEIDGDICDCHVARRISDNCGVTENAATRWDEERQEWQHVKLQPSSHASARSWRYSKHQQHTPVTSIPPQPQQPANKPTHLLPAISHIIFATSTPPNIHNFPFLQAMHREYPIEAIHGLPALTRDLMWSEDVPLFVTGALAGLRLGPGAGNLAGARLGAERVAWGLDEVLGRGGACGGEGDGHLDRVGNGNGNQDQDQDQDRDELEVSVNGLNDVKRDSGYVSEIGEDKRAGNGYKMQVKDLLEHYSSGLGNRFEGLSLLDHCDRDSISSVAEMRHGRWRTS